MGLLEIHLRRALHGLDAWILVSTMKTVPQSPPQTSCK